LVSLRGAQNLKLRHCIRLLVWQGTGGPVAGILASDRCAVDST